MGSATILGNEYQTVVMPSGLEWIAEDFDDNSFSPSIAVALTGVRIYGGAAIDAINSSLADGWRVATYADFLEMVTSLQDVSYSLPLVDYPIFFGAGGHLKSMDSGAWAEPNAGADDIYSFGARSTVNTGLVSSLTQASYWLSDDFDLGKRSWALFANNTTIETGSGALETNYYAVRLVRDLWLPRYVNHAEGVAQVKSRWTNVNGSLRKVGSRWL